MAAPLIIRNVTSTPIELKVVERYAAPAEPASPPPHVAAIAKVKAFIKNDPRPSSAAIAQSAQAFNTQEVSIRVEPLTTVRTEIKAAETAIKETVRLTFEAEGERHRVDTPTVTFASSVPTPLTPNPRFHYTAVYLPDHSHLTLFSSANLASWMREFKDETPVSALSMPGTHNSPTYHRALPSVRCQAVGIREQLDNGVRFFDIRVQPEDPEDRNNETLNLVHGVFPISLTGNKLFRDLVNEVFAFLDQNPSETLVMSIKREGPGTHNDAQLSRRLRDHYAGDVNRWFTAPRIPTLGEARRKIILMRRFGLEEGLKSEWGGQGWGINAETWAYNTPHDMCPSGDVCVQDFCEVLENENIDKKVRYSQEELVRAAASVCDFGHSTIPINVEGAPPAPPVPAPTKQPFYLNFLSASNFWKVDFWPERIAAKLNPSTVDYLCRRHNEPGAVAAVTTTDGQAAPLPIGDGCTGIVVCDWVGDRGDWDLVRCVVGWNVKLEMREKGLTP